MMTWDYETERRTRRLARSQPAGWWPVIGYGGALVLSLVAWRVVWRILAWLWLAVGIAAAQGAFEVPGPSRAAEDRSPRELAASRATFHPRFWTPSTIALIALDGAAKSADGYWTRVIVGAGGYERNPLMRPWAHSDRGEALALAGTMALEVGAAWWLTHHGHPRWAKVVLAVGAAGNVQGAANSARAWYGRQGP